MLRPRRHTLRMRIKPLRHRKIHNRLPQLVQRSLERAGHHEGCKGQSELCRVRYVLPSERARRLTRCLMEITSQSDSKTVRTYSAESLSKKQIARWMGVAIAAFHVAYLVPALAFLMVLFLYALIKLTEAPTPRWAFYPALLVGIASYAPQTTFLWGLFGVVAISLWTILSIWIAFFVLMAWSLRRVPWFAAHMWVWALSLPVMWMGLEYFRSELYWLKFAWLTPGIAIANGWILDLLLVKNLGIYGTGFAVMAVAALFTIFGFRPFLKLSPWIFVVVLVYLILLPSLNGSGPRPGLVVGIQLEGPSEAEILHALNAAVSKYPDLKLLVMSEYSLDTPPTRAIRNWCQENGRYLIIGGKEITEKISRGKEVWTDTAFVIDPKGDIVFSQGKVVPIQFFDDGAPAKGQQLWNSPWGKVGICICYDLSFTRVTDELIRQGATLLVVPTMDAEKWGAYEHHLHALIAPARALEYNVHIVRVGSSGISQITSGFGFSQNTAPFPGQGEMVAAQLLSKRLLREGSLPLDRHFAPLCVVLTGSTALFLLVRRYWGVELWAYWNFLFRNVI